MPTANVRPEIILPLQEAVSRHIDEVHSYMELGRLGLASNAMDDLLRVGQRINYAVVGRADIETSNHADSLEAERDELMAERKRHETWISKQHGAKLTKNPNLLGNIKRRQNRIKTIESRALPNVETKLSAFAPTIDEIESVAEITGEAWPYYPELSPARQTTKELARDDSAIESSNDQSTRAQIHNIISRLSYAKKSGLGLRYNVLTAYFFNQHDQETKSVMAKTLASMRQDGSVRVWQEGAEWYIESNVLETTQPADESEAKMVVVQLDLDDEITRTFVSDIFRWFGLAGYRRIESDDKLELQVKMSFANQFALSHNLVLSKQGPSSYRLLNNE